MVYYRRLLNSDTQGPEIIIVLWRTIVVFGGLFSVALELRGWAWKYCHCLDVLDIQDLPGQYPVQPALGDPASAGGWTGWPTEVPSKPHRSVILCLFHFYKTFSDVFFPPPVLQARSSYVSEFPYWDALVPFVVLYPPLRKMLIFLLAFRKTLLMLCWPSASWMSDPLWGMRCWSQRGHLPATVEIVWGEWKCYPGTLFSFYVK